MEKTVRASSRARNSAPPSPSVHRLYIAALRATARWCLLVQPLLCVAGDTSSPALVELLTAVRDVLLAAVSEDEDAPFAKLAWSATGIAATLDQWQARAVKCNAKVWRTVAPEWTEARFAVVRAIEACEAARTGAATVVFRFLVFSGDDLVASAEHRTKLHEAKVKATRAMRRASGTHVELYRDGVMVARRVNGSSRWEVSL